MNQLFKNHRDKLTKPQSFGTLLLWYIIAVLAGAYMGYSLLSYQVQWECVDKGYMSLGRGYYCNAKYGETL